MKIEHLYVPDVHTCHLHESLIDVASRMRQAGVSALPVVDDLGGLVAIISERDLVRALADRVNPDVAAVAQYATDAVALADVDEDSVQVGKRMLEAGIRHLPVTAGEQLVGIVSMRDLLAVQTWA